jgi:PIN domain nuclease of toxin-antitoxin system
MSRVVVDTHVAVWSLVDRSLLSAPATAILVAADAMGEIIVSAITLIELTYLTEKGRLRESSVRSSCDICKRKSMAHTRLSARRLTITPTNAENW